MSVDKQVLHVVSHTHWDREWYQPFQEYRLRLVDMMDALLDLMQADQRYRYFTLDGQTVVLEDYLEIRPEREAELRKLAAAGRLLLGPSYVLPDEFLVSGEALVRNLMLGHRMALEYGGQVMKVGYYPDPFGHIAQLPQILLGFGIDNAVFFRGVPQELNKSEFRWVGPDGSSVLGIFMPDGYCNAQFLPVDSEAALERVQSLRERLSAFATTPNLLLMNGCDHTPAQAELPRLLEELNQRLEGAVLVHSHLPGYIAAVRERLPERLPELRGELRDSAVHFLLFGVLSSRMYLKMANRRCERLLECWAEPVSALAWALGKAYPRSELWRAWRYLLQNHPHDSICGCSVDAVHRQMMARFEWASDLGEDIVRRGLTYIGCRVEVSRGPDEEVLLVFNPLPFARSEVVNVTVDLPQPCDARQVAITTATGEELVPQVCGYDDVVSYPMVDEWPRERRVRRFNVSLPLELPAMGYQVLRARPLDVRPRFTTGVAREPGVLENEELLVSVMPDGSVAVTDKKAGLELAPQLVFEDRGDAGDEYNYAWPLADRTVLSTAGRASVSILERGPYLGRLRIEQVMEVPAGLTADRRSRSEELVPLHLSTDVTLRQGSRLVEFRTLVRNRARDHRLRVLFTLGRAAMSSAAEMQYTVVSRPVRADSWEGYGQEEPPNTNPQGYWVDVTSQGYGIAVLNDGLPEYELLPGEEGVLALTLLRCVGWLSRPDLTTRRGNAGPQIEAPEAQCLGDYTFRYALVPHQGDWKDALVPALAQRFALPPRPFPLLNTPKDPQLPAVMSFLRLTPPSLVLTALKKAEDAELLVARFYNPTAGAVEAQLELGLPVIAAYELTLAEERVRSLAVNGHGVRLVVGPSKIATIGFELARQGGLGRR